MLSFASPAVKMKVKVKVQKIMVLLITVERALVALECQNWNLSQS